jgi:hypothetical protein
VGEGQREGLMANGEWLPLSHETCLE